MARLSKNTPERCKSPFSVVLRTLMSAKPATTQEKLAEITGKTRQTVSQYVNGISEPGYDTLIKIANYFDVSIDYLLGRTQDPTQKYSSIDQLGLSPASAEWLIEIKKNNLSTELITLLENPSFQRLVVSILDFSVLVEAETISDRVIAPKAKRKFQEGNEKKRFVSEVDIYDKELEKAINDCEGRIKDALQAMRDFELAASEGWSEALSQVLDGRGDGDGVMLSDIAKHRINERLLWLLVGIREHHLLVHDSEYHARIYGNKPHFDGVD